MALAAAAPLLEGAWPEAAAAWHPSAAYAQQPGDTAATLVLNVTSAMPNRVYSLGERIEIAVNFDGPVVVRPGAPTSLAIGLDGGASRTASYESGNGTSSLNFTYTVQSGDMADDLDYRNATALEGNIVGAGGGAVGLSLPIPGSSGSLAQSGDILVDWAAPQLIAENSVRSNDGGFGRLTRATAVSAFDVDGRTYAAVAIQWGEILLVRVHENGTLLQKHLVRDDTSTLLSGTGGVTALVVNSSTYTIATSCVEGVQMLRMYNNNETLKPWHSLADNSTLALNCPGSADVFSMDSGTHAITGAFLDNGVQLIRIRGDGTLEARGSLFDNSTLRLGWAAGVAAFDLDGAPHALVTSNAEHGVQLIRIRGDGTLEARGSLVDNGTLALGTPGDVAAFDLDGAPHALVSSATDDGVQLIRIRGDGTLEARGSLVDDDTLALNTPSAFSVFGSPGGGAYAAVASGAEHGIQLIRMRGSDGAVFPAGSVTNGTNGFDELHVATGIDTFSLGGGTYALSSGADRNTGGLQLVRLSPSSVAAVTATAANGTYGQGASIGIEVTFNEKVNVTGTPELRLNSVGSAAYGSGSGSKTLVFNYTVGPNDSVAVLAYAGADALSDPGSITEAKSGVTADSTLPPPGSPGSLSASRAIAIDGIAPRVLGAAPAVPDGAYGEGRVITVAVDFSERVSYSGDQPELLLNVSGAPAAAAYASGNGTASLNFTYTVRAGDNAGNLDYWNTTALSGDIVDAPGNRAVLDLPEPGSPGSLAASGSVAVETARPEIDRVSSPNASRAYGPGDRIEVRVAFDEAVEVDAERGTPTLLLDTGRAGAHATYQTGSGTPTLMFRYTVAPVDESDDLGYDGASALSLNGGTIMDAAGNHANLTLPAPGSAGSLSGSAAISVAHVEPPLIASDSVDKDDHGGLPLDQAQGVDAFAMGNGTYVIATSPSDDAVQLLRVHENGTLSPAGNATDGGSLLLGGAVDVAALRIGNDTFAIVAAGTEPAVQLLRVHENGTLSPAGNATDGGDFRLGAPSGVDAFVTGDGRAYAVVASLTANEIQVVRIHGNNGTLSAGPGMSATVAGTGLGAWYADAFAVGDRAYALVTATHDYDGVQLFRLHDDGRLELNASATDGAGGFDALNGSRGVDTFAMGNATYAIVVSEHDGDGGAVQLIRVHYNGTLEAAGSAFNGTRGFDALGGAYGVSVFNGTFGDPYAVVTSEAGDAVQLVHIHDDGTLLPAGSAADEMPGPGGKPFDELAGPQGVASFHLDGRAYAAVASRNDSGVQLIRLSPASATGATISPAGGAHGLGAELAIEVAFDGRVNVTGLPELPLNSGGVAVYQSGSNNSRTLEFLYTVAPGESAEALDYHEDEYALYGPGGIVEAETGVDADRTLPVPGSPGSLSAPIAIRIDGIAPRVAIVTSATPDGEYGASRVVSVNVSFTEPVSYRGAAPSLLLNAGGVVPVPAAYASGNGTKTIGFAYTVRPGDMSDDLAYWNTTALSGGLSDDVGNAANLTLPDPGGLNSLSRSAAIEIDGIAPRVAGVASATPDGEYGAGERIEVAVAFTEPVSYSGSAPVLLLNVSGAPAPAAYAGGNGTASLAFAYTVQAGDSSGDLAYWNTTALSGGLADAVGNEASRTLPAPGSPGSLSGQRTIVLDTAAPRVASVTSATPDGEYGEGSRIEIAVTFTEPVSYRGEAPSILLDVGGGAPAAYASGNGTATLSFAYTVRADDMSDDLGYRGAAALSGQIADAAGNAADLALPEPGSPGSLSGSASVSVDGSAPAAATADAAFTGPNTIRIEYSAPLGPPAGHAGPVYGAVTVAGNDMDTLPGGVSGLGTAVHTIRFGGDGVDADQNGTIALGTALEGRESAARYAFPAGAIPVRAGEAARTLSPPGTSPVVAIEYDGFVRAVNATGAGEAARPAIDVSGLSNTTLSADASRNSVRFPVEAVSLTASFAEVAIPPNATAEFVPADGRLDLYVSAQGPTERQVADALGASAGAVGSIRVVEVGDNATHIVFDLPVRILLVGQANGTAFYVNNTDRTVVPIRAECAVDDTDAVHKRLNGTGIDECWLDSGADKVIYTYHLTLFGTAMAPGGGPLFVPVCSISLVPQQMQQQPVIGFGDVREGAQSAAMDQEMKNAGTLPIATVTIRATAWTDASGSEAMPANATSVLAGAQGWVALDGEVDLPGGADGATAKFRVEVPTDALPEGAAPAGVEASQTVTYTAACRPPP